MIVNDVIKEMNDAFGLGIVLVDNGGAFSVASEEDEMLNQIKEKYLDTVRTPFYKRNLPQADQPYGVILAHIKDVYIFKDHDINAPTMVKIRYEERFGENAEQILYQFDKNISDFVECMRASPGAPYRFKTFRCYNVVDGQIVEGPLPKDKKNLIYNVEALRDHSPGEQKQDIPWIWFVEGEKDVETLKKYGIIACSLMKGTGSNWDQKYNTLFQRCNVIIATDFDEPGRKYGSYLFDTLYYAKYKERVDGDEEPWCTIGLKIMNPNFYERDGMPEKSDITDLVNKWKRDGLTKDDIKANLTEIVERSIDHKDFSSLHPETDGLFVGGKQVADFTVEGAISILAMGSDNVDALELTIRGTGIASKITHKKRADIHEIFGSADAFNKAFSVIDSTFMGDKGELHQLKQYIYKYYVFKNKYLYATNGMYQHNGEWVVITPDGTLRRDGSWDQDIMSSNTICYPDIEKASLPNPDETNQVGTALLSFNTPLLMYNILGEVGAKLLNARYKKIGIKNQLFSLNGTKGAGKTETTVKIMAPITNDSTSGETSLSGQTAFTYMKNVGANNIGGVILQELKLGKMSELDRNRWSETFRNNYDRSRSQRGTKDQSLNVYEQLNSLVLTGEEGIGEESALYERFNIVFMTANDRTSDPIYEESFRTICDNQGVLNGIGKQILVDVMNISDDEILSGRKQLESMIRLKGLDKRGFVDRVLNNTINTIQGFGIVAKGLKSLGYTGEIHYNEAFDSIIENYSDNVLRINDSKANDDYQKMLLQYQLALDNNYDDKVVGAAENAYSVHDKSLWISPSKLRTIIANFVHDTHTSITILSENEFRKNLVKAGYISDDDRRKFNQTKAKGHFYRANVTQMQQLGLDFIEQLITTKSISAPEDFLTASKEDSMGNTKSEAPIF